uniref:Ubiquitin-like protein ATG12 n=1 Tax=Meleagris gallopavo TaxID=9103 RepID=A0A803Y685_MELGA
MHIPQLPCACSSLSHRHSPYVAFSELPHRHFSHVKARVVDPYRCGIDVLLKAVGDTPIMKTKKWAVERTRTIQGLCDFIKKFLKLMASEQLFIYVNQSFAPSPDQEVGTLYECFGSDGKLVLHYCKTQAWG